MNQYRHGKSILALGASRILLEQAGIPGAENGDTPSGVLVVDSNGNGVARDFIASVSKHRHPEREADMTSA